MRTSEPDTPTVTSSPTSLPAADGGPADHPAEVADTADKPVVDQPVSTDASSAMTPPASESLGARAATAAKWSVLTQLAAKLISPLTTMILARILTPEAFGVVATATMITSLAEMLSDAGFHRYLVQHAFDTDDDKSLAACVAFWTNVGVSLIIMALIVVFNEPLAAAVGNPGLGMVLIVASLSLPLVSLTTVQTALYQRDLDFKTLFSSKVGASLLILVVSVPLALIGLDFWSLIIGTIASNVFLATWLTLKSTWRPRPRYSLAWLRRMLSFGVWILLESALTWVNTWAGTFIIGALMSAYEVGMYKTSTTICAAVTGIFTAALLPIAFSALSKVQDDDGRFERVFLQMQRYLGMCLIPVALGMMVFRDLFTWLALGPQWSETALFIGLWSLAGCIVIVYGYLCSEAYRAKGKPAYCVIVQALYLVPFLPTLWLSCLQGYDCVSVAVPLVRLTLVAINLVVVRLALGLSPARMLIGTKWFYLQAAVALAPGFVTVMLTDSLIAAGVGAAASVPLYIGMLWAVRETRETALDLLQRLGLLRLGPLRRLSGRTD